MGLFSGKTTTHIKAVSRRLLDDKGFKYSHQQAVSRWIWETNGKGYQNDKPNLSNYLLQANQSSLPKSFDRLYRYTKKPANYVFGLPTSHLSGHYQKEVKESLTKYLKGQGIKEKEIYTTWLGEKDFYISAWLKLIKDYGYNSKTNELTKLSNQHGKACYLKDGYLVVNNNTHQEYPDLNNKGLPMNFGEIPNSRKQDTSRQQTAHKVVDEDAMLISYVVANETKTLHLDLSFVNPIKVTGNLIVSDKDYVYAIYKKQGKYEFFEYEFGSGLIPQIDNALSVGDTFGEYYPKIYFRINQKDVLESQDTTRKKHLNKALKYINQDAKELANQLKKGIGADYQDIHGMYVFLGARINEADKDPVIAEYCFRYFKRLNDLAKKEVTGQVVADNTSQQHIQTNKIEHTKQSGKKTQVGSYTAVFGQSDGDYCHELIYQITDNEYESVKIYGLKLTNTMGTLTYTNQANDEDLVIPIDKSLVDDLSKKEKEVLIHKSLHLQIILAKVTKQKWYETDAFKWAVAIVGVALTVVFAPAGASVMATLKAVAVSTVKAMTLAYAVNAVLGMAVKAGIIDIKTATVIGFVANIAIMAYGVGFDFSKLLTAPNIMKVVNTSFETYGKILMLEIQDTQRKMAELVQTAKDRQAMIDKAQKLLDTKVFDMDLELLKSNYTPQVNLFETVEMFYSRHNNFDVVGLSHALIDDFVSVGLHMRPPNIQRQNSDFESLQIQLL